MLLASFTFLSSFTFIGYWPTLLQCLGGAINGRMCPCRGYKRTLEDDGDSRQLQVAGT